MDVFSRTFLPAAAEAGVAIPTVTRHMQVFRNCVSGDDATALVAGRLPVVDIPDAGHHPMLDRPLSLVTGVRTLLAVWPAGA